MNCAVEMPGRGKPQAVSHRLWKSLRDSHIPTASTATIHQSRKKGVPLEPYPTPPGSFLDEKMLVLPWNGMPHLEAALINVSLLWLLTVPHEFAHAWVATRLGDDTPRLDGRVTLNPLAHVDWLGTVLIPALTTMFGGGLFGWGRAVRTNPD